MDVGTKTAAGTAIRAAMNGGGDAAIGSACALLNTIRLTVDQFENGRRVYDAVTTASTDPFDKTVRPRAWAALEAYCVGEGLEPAEIAAWAILLRWEPVLETKHEFGIDLKSDDPKAYMECVSGAIDQGYFRYLTPDEIDASGKVIPLSETSGEG